MHDPLDDAEALPDCPDETDDERGPVCVECLDVLPIGHEGRLCDDCEEAAPGLALERLAESVPRQRELIRDVIRRRGGPW